MKQKSHHEYQDDVRKGDHAQRLIADPMLNESLEDIRQSIYDQIRKSAFSQTDEREECYRMLRTLDSFEGKLKKRIESGKLAKSIMDSLKDKLTWS